METNRGAKIRVHGSNHKGTIFTIFEKLLNTESLVDVTLAAEGKYIRAHKIILSACSPYFQDLLSIDNSKHPILFMSPGIKFSELRALLNYLYKGETFIQQEELPSLLKLAESLQIRGLAETNDDNNAPSSMVTNLQPQPPAATTPLEDLRVSRAMASGQTSILEQDSTRVTGHQDTERVSALFRHNESHSDVPDQSGIQLIDQSTSFLFNRIQQLTNDSSSTKTVVGSKRSIRDMQIPYATGSQANLGLPSKFISSSPTASTSQLINLPGKRLCKENFIEPSAFPTAQQVLVDTIAVDEEEQPLRDYSFIDESSQDQFDMCKNPIKVEETIITDRGIREELVDASPGENHLSTDQWILQESSSRDGGSLPDPEDTSRTDRGEGDGERCRKEYECSVCHVVYVRKSSLVRHVSYECNITPRFQCTICGRKLKHKSHLINHEGRCIKLHKIH